MAGYWGANHWNANYWHANHWGEPVNPVQGTFWNANYWHVNHWQTNYWADASDTLTISQTSTPQLLFTTPQASVTLEYFAFPGTPNLPLATFQADAANDITVEATLATLALTGINTTFDSGTSYVGDISFTVFASSTFGWTDTVDVTLSTLPLVAINAGVEEGNSQLISVTSTPALTLSPFPTATANTVRVDTNTPGLAIAKFNVTTGFGTVVEGTAPNVPINTAQTNVFGTNADFQEFDATLSTLALTAYNADVVGVSIATGVRRGGGWEMVNWYDAHKQKKSKRKKKVQELLEVIADPVDNEIAKLLHEVIEQEFEQQELGEVKNMLAETFPANEIEQARVMKQAKAYNEKAAKAFERAAKQGNYSAIKAFEREMDRAIEEEEFLFLALIALR
jgi:hypothetical protein